MVEFFGPECADNCQSAEWCSTFGDDFQSATIHCRKAAATSRCLCDQPKIDLLIPAKGGFVNQLGSTVPDMNLHPQEPEYRKVSLGNSALRQ